MAAEQIVTAYAVSDDDDQPAAQLPSFQVNHSFLEDNAQSHASPLSAFGDIIDNSKESGATEVSLTVSKQGPTVSKQGPTVSKQSPHVLRILDNGAGMSEKMMRDGVMSIGYTDKRDLSSGKHYGFGLKTALPRLADYALIFSRRGDTGHRSVGLVSTEFSRQVDGGQLKLPLCSWEAETDFLLDGSHADAPLRTLQREASIQSLLDLQGLPYRDKRDLLSEFERMRCNPPGLGPSGTLIVMWSLKKELDLRNKSDIRVKFQHESSPRHQTSLRAYLGVLYLKVSRLDISPRMSIILNGVPVAVRDWSDYLKDMGRQMNLEAPAKEDVLQQFSSQSNNATPSREAAMCARNARATMAIGYARDFAEIVEHCSANGGSDGKGKQELAREETGLFYYHKGRMTLALEKTERQKKKSGASLTTAYRLTTLGQFITGYIDENFLVQHHTKSAYAPNASTLKMLSKLMEAADLKMQEFIKPQVVVRLCEVQRKSWKKLPKASICAGFSKGLWREVEKILGDRENDEENFPFKASLSSSGLATMSRGSGPLGEGSPLTGGTPGPSAAARAELEPDARMRPLNRKDKTVGRVELEPGTTTECRLRQEDGTLSAKIYTAAMLEKTRFNPEKDLPRLYQPAPQSLHGCHVQVLWRDEGLLTSKYWDGYLRATGDAGWFDVCYTLPAGDDFEVEEDVEAIFVGLRPGHSDECKGYRGDGEALEWCFAKDPATQEAVAAAAKELLDQMVAKAAGPSSSHDAEEHDVQLRQMHVTTSRPAPNSKSQAASRLRQRSNATGYEMHLSPSADFAAGDLHQEEHETEHSLARPVEHLVLMQHTEVELSVSVGCASLAAELSEMEREKEQAWARISASKHEVRMKRAEQMTLETAFRQLGRECDEECGTARQLREQLRHWLQRFAAIPVDASRKAASSSLRNLRSDAEAALLELDGQHGFVGPRHGCQHQRKSIAEGETDRASQQNSDACCHGEGKGECAPPTEPHGDQMRASFSKWQAASMLNLWRDFDDFGDDPLRACGYGSRQKRKQPERLEPSSGTSYGSGTRTEKRELIEKTCSAIDETHSPAMATTCSHQGEHTSNSVGARSLDGQVEASALHGEQTDGPDPSRKMSIDELLRIGQVLRADKHAKAVWVRVWWPKRLLGGELVEGSGRLETGKLTSVSLPELESAKGGITCHFEVFYPKDGKPFPHTFHKNHVELHEDQDDSNHQITIDTDVEEEHFPEPPPPEILEVGSKVMAKYLASAPQNKRRKAVGANEWYPGIIHARDPNGRFTINFDDGDVEEGVLQKFIKLQ